MRRMLREVLFVRNQRANRCLLVLCSFIFCYALLITTFGGPHNSQNQRKQFKRKQFKRKQFGRKQFERKQFESKQFENKQLIAFFSSKRKQLLISGFLTFFL
jgi:hypothetical protein